ncbi:MAG: rRNA (guanine966-N2)-methyltransferase [Aliidongia sp.]|jgi:16S rRNA (guanine966-N2)-methyltransferase|nr:rRNA (guanine966-N2)-methyltransferase [Aliidongia sp.]
MRIVAGKHRGRKLLVPEGDTVRPTSDRAREALFNILEHGRFAAGGSPLLARRVLDAFAGTGALGLEALSRGAAQVSFLELAPAIRKLLATNIAMLGEEVNSRILAGDATRPPPAAAPVGLAFLDPPYGKGLGGAALVALGAAGWFEPATLIVLEIGAKEEPDLPAGFTLRDDRRYGAARLLFLAAPAR